MKPIDIPTSDNTRIRVRINNDSVEMASQEELEHSKHLVWVEYAGVKVYVSLSEWAAFKAAVDKIDRMLILK